MALALESAVGTAPLTSLRWLRLYVPLCRLLPCGRSSSPVPHTCMTESTGRAPSSMLLLERLLSVLSAGRAAERALLLRERSALCDLRRRA